MTTRDKLSDWLSLRAGAFKLGVTDAMAAFRLCVAALEIREKRSDLIGNMVIFNTAAAALDPKHVPMTRSHGFREAVGTCLCCMRAAHWCRRRLVICLSLPPHSATHA